jgi:hypothetical protein
MKETTKELFRKKLKEIIDDLCIKSKKLYRDENRFDLIFSYYYYEYRRWIHISMELTKNMDRKEMRMDRHKIAAAFLCSILKAKPIGYNNDGKMPTFLERTANEQLGLIFGIYIIDRFNISKTDITSLEKEIYGLPIRLPVCGNNNDEEYTTHFTKLFLDKRVKENLDFDHPNFNITLLFFISHIFFLIDSFSYYKNFSILGGNDDSGI